MDKHETLTNQVLMAPDKNSGAEIEIATPRSAEGHPRLERAPPLQNMARRKTVRID